ncbi:Gcd10p family-domain-containing protein [Leptodontidium sp. 2 PMI_412]|nr:Gcd10p family-domain-containing protein [Leptodontidium sp. 2 PMI_412]
MHSLVEPNAWVVLRLPSDTLKILQVAPNTIVSLGKYGTFSSNLLLGRPYNKTYELLDRAPGQKDSDLRIVPASELHADTIAEEQAAACTSNGAGKDGNVTIGGDGVEFQLVGENGEVIMRSNRETIDDAAQQTLSMEEIEELKREGTGAGKDLIAKLMASHLGIEQKTAFSLAKYKLLKTKKYLRRFTVLPVDVPMLIKWVMDEKDASKIMDMREEMCALVGSWANVHFAEKVDGAVGGRWLVVDETGGLLVAALAERMGILHHTSPSSDASNRSQAPEGEQGIEAEEESTKPTHHDQPLATSNTITLIHNNAQPNLSLLKYFSYDPTTTTPPHPNHPLATHLHPISWLQLVSPSEDTTYSTSITPLSPTSLSALKSGKRGTYYRKLRRHNRVKSIVDSTLAGGFDGLVVASHIDPVSILRHTIPLLRGGAQIAIYSPTIESLVKLSDVYSTSRRTAFIQAPPESFLSLPLSPEPTETTTPETQDQNQQMLTQTTWPGDDDFPLNPTLLLNTAVQSARIREWQVLPGRTHPVMTGRGGAEGYLFTGIRVIPARGRVAARGKFAKKKADKIGKSVEIKEGVDDGVVQNGAELQVDVVGGKRELGEGEMSPTKRVKLAEEGEREI